MSGAGIYHAGQGTQIILVTWWCGGRKKASELGLECANCFHVAVQLPDPSWPRSALLQGSPWCFQRWDWHRQRARAAMWKCPESAFCHQSRRRASKYKKLDLVRANAMKNDRSGSLLFSRKSGFFVRCAAAAVWMDGSVHRGCSLTQQPALLHQDGAGAAPVRNPERYLPLCGYSSLQNLGFCPVLKVNSAVRENRTFEEEANGVNQLWEQ